MKETALTPTQSM